MKVKLFNGRTVELLLDGKTVMMVYAEESGTMGRSDPILLAVIVGEDVKDCQRKYLASKGVIETEDIQATFDNDMSEWRFHMVYKEPA